jgi:hypothetical protein
MGRLFRYLRRNGKSTAIGVLGLASVAYQIQQNPHVLLDEDRRATIAYEVVMAGSLIAGRDPKISEKEADDAPEG